LGPLSEQIPQKLRMADQPLFFESIGFVAERRRCSVIYELNSKGLGEFATEALLDDPSRLVCELYSRMTLQENLGNRLHEFAAQIAGIYDISVNKIREHLVNSWLREIEKHAVVETQSIFCETFEEAVQKDENTNIQKALFILRAWNSRTAAKWLLRFIYQADPIPCRVKAKAFSCLFAVSGEDEIRSAFKGDFSSLLALHQQLYFGSRLEYFEVPFNLTEFNKENVAVTIQKYLTQPIPAGAFRVLLELVLDAQLADRAALLTILTKLKESRKRFLLRMIGQVFQVFRQFAADMEFQELYREIVSYPIDCFISKQPDTLPIRPHHLSVLRDLVEALAFEPFKIVKWKIGGADVEWPELVRLLCDAGFVALGAEIGGLVVEEAMRDNVLAQLMDTGHFDEAIRFGFDRDKIFRYILRIDQLKQATEILIDQHLDWFVEWLAGKRDVDALEKVQMTLKKQGRTKEATRIAEKTAGVVPRNS
jgi:hypothetical protein